MYYVVALKSGTKILVESVTDIFRNEDFIDFCSEGVLKGSFNIDNISHYIKINNPEEFKTMEVYAG